MHSPESFGMLKGGQNMMEMPCKEIKRSVPYFEEINEEEQGSPNDIVFEFFEGISATEIDFSNKLYTVPNLEKVPDGIL
jgi:hypothetical protein